MTYFLLGCGESKQKVQKTKGTVARWLVWKEGFCRMSWGSVGTASVFSVSVATGKNTGRAQMSFKGNMGKDLQQPQNEAFLTRLQATVVTVQYGKRAG